MQQDERGKDKKKKQNKTQPQKLFKEMEKSIFYNS